MCSIQHQFDGTNGRRKTEASEEEEDSGYLDDIVARNLVKDQRILDYQPIREADIVWDKRIWRVIDVREKMNLPFVYPVRPFSDPYSSC